MALPVPFGFSAGDVVTVCILVKDVIKALDDAQGASTEYQRLIQELWSLDRALLEVELLSRTCDTSIELNALSQTTRRVVDQCKVSMELFLRKLRTYNCSLREGGSGDRIRDAAKKIKWALTQKEEVARFRTEINGHSSTINMLLITASINLTKLTERNIDSHFLDAQEQRDNIQEQQSAALAIIQVKLDESERNMKEHGTNTSRLVERMNYFFKLGAELKTFMFNIWFVNFKTYHAVVDLQTRIPREFKPCWIQEPLILTDALGRVAPIHLELINSWDVFESVLVARFNQLPGQGKITRREYAIQETTLKLEIDRSQSFESSFLPGRKLDMSMIFKAFDGRNENSCPSCRTTSHVNSDSEIKCSKCGTWYQRITDLGSSAREDSLDSFGPTCTERRDGSKGQQGQDHAASTRTHKRNFSEAALGDDDVRAFRRVRLLYPCQPAGNRPSSWRALTMSRQMTFDNDDDTLNAIDSGRVAPTSSIFSPLLRKKVRVDNPDFPQGGCRYIMLHPEEVKGLRCHCVGFVWNRVIPGNACNCGHQPCYHTPEKEGVSVQQREIEALKKKIDKLKEELYKERSGKRGGLADRIRRMEELVDR
ncbi:hypothetical protein DL98DRAFT_214990 [Cadophora sp. DSE1049]|nr:hypothetical protein DL98DRAFT_214990 [Cadophora sp. DSE1049]